MRYVNLFVLLVILVLAVPVRAVSAQTSSSSSATAPGVLHADDSESGSESPVVARSALTHALLEHNQNLRKTDLLLAARSDDEIKTGRLYVGAAVTAIADYQWSNRDSKFGYLMRHPTANNQVGDRVSEAVLHSAQIMFAGSVTDWLTVFSEVLYDPEQSFGTGTNTGLARNQLQLRKGLVVVGNLAKFPLYATLGKGDVNFGLMGSVSPFTNSTMWHAFGVLAYNASVGIVSSGFNASFTAVQGGAQFRAAHAPVDSTAVPSRVNNFAADASYTLDASDDLSVMVGGSYLHASAYCQGFPVVHFQPCAERNPAWTAYGEVRALDQRLLLRGGFSKTTEVWPGTANPHPPLSEFPASKVSSKSIGARYLVAEKGRFRWTVSAEFSDFVAGPDGAPWERQNQWVVGARATLNSSSRLFLEGFRTEGFAPLNFISGGHIALRPHITHSEADARSHGVIVGAQITL